MTPSPEVKNADLCCGLGFGKTLLGIQLAACTLDSAPGHVGLFQEPDWTRVQHIFLPLWEQHIPEELYEIYLSKDLIIWKPTRSKLIFKPRIVTGSLAQRRALNRGIPTSFVIDDETAIGYDQEQYQNTFARIRLDAEIRYWLGLSTPLVGPYANHLKRGGNKIFTGRTRDNFYLLHRDPTYESRQRAQMSEQQARRELDGELIALEGRIWNTARWDAKEPACAWPNGNRNDEHVAFRPGEPYWLFCDLGVATGAYAVVQRMQPIFRGRRLFSEPVWVAIADYCPDDDANAARAFTKIKREFGIPAAVVGGADIETRERTDGNTVAYFAQQIFGSQIKIMPCNESWYNKQIQYDCLSYLMCNTRGERRFTVARDFVSLDTRSRRGIREMLLEDQWPPIEKRRQGDFLPKNKEITVQHIRDALLMGTAQIMKPPRWGHREIHAA